MLLHLLSTALLSKKLAEHGSRNSVSYYHVPSLHTSTDLKCLTDKIIPRQLFEVPIQATVGKKVIARETLSAMRADVTAGLYGGASKMAIPNVRYFPRSTLIAHCRSL